MLPHPVPSYLKIVFPTFLASHEIELEAPYLACKDVAYDPQEEAKE